MSAIVAGCEVLLVAAPASAQIAPTITVSVSTSSVSFSSLAPNDPSATTNRVSAGTITITSTAGYTVKVAADRTAMTEWTGTAYVTSSPKTLGSPLQATCSAPTGTGATCSALTATSITPSGATFATSAVSTGAGSHVFTLTLSQPTALTDYPATYHLVLTITASALLG